MRPGVRSNERKLLQYVSGAEPLTPPLEAAEAHRIAEGRSMLQHLITWAFQLSILATAFGFGLKAMTEDVQDVIRRPALLGRSLLAIFGIVRIVAVPRSHAIDLPHASRIGMIPLA